MKLASDLQWARWKRRLRKPSYYTWFLFHGLIGMAAMNFPALWAIPLVFEMKQASNNDPAVSGGRPSSGTGWLDGLTDVTAFVGFACVEYYTGALRRTALWLF